MARDEATLRIEKLAKLVTAATELTDHMNAVLAECREIIGGGAGIAAKLQQVERAWKDAWSARYHGEYVFNYARDRAQLKRLLRTFSVEELQARMVRYLQSDEIAVCRERHPFTWFCSSVNRYAPESSTTDLTLAAPVADCKHMPRCTSDQQHTERKMRDLRG